MRFKRQARHPFTDTSRKRAALRRKQRLERESLPLFAEQISAEQPDEDTVMLERAARWLKVERADRQRRAEDWRRARVELNAFSHNERTVLLAAWNRAPYPADPVYLFSFLHRYRVGRFNLDQMPFEGHKFSEAC